jgi:hypothetical protein
VYIISLSVGLGEHDSLLVGYMARRVDHTPSRPVVHVVCVAVDRQPSTSDERAGLTLRPRILLPVQVSVLAPPRLRVFFVA